MGCLDCLHLLGGTPAGARAVRVDLIGWVFLLLGSQPLVAGPPSVSFVDVSASAGLHSIPWVAATDLNGVNAADVNNDGWPDLFFPRALTGTASLLYINNQDGTFTEAAAAWGIADTNDTRSALFFDYDNDGLLDLALGNVLANGDSAMRLFHHQTGADYFDDVTVAAGLDYVLPGNGRPTSMAAGNLDSSGRLYLVMGSQNGAALDSVDVCFEYQGDGTFVDVRSDMGMSGQSRTWQMHMADLDMDGLTDILTSQDSFTPSRVNLGQNPSGVLEVGAQVGITDLAPDMGIAVGDYDNDGDFDFYVTDITLECPASSSTGLNHLYRNELYPSSQLSFTNTAATCDCSHSAFGWGCTFVDYDHDGWLDLAAAAFYCESVFFRNLANGTFSSVGASLGFSPLVAGGGLIAVDYDLDGDQDLVLANQADLPLLYRNDGGNQVGWLIVDPRHAPNNRNAIGAKLRVSAGSLSMLRQITAGCSFNSQEPSCAHFGIAAAGTVDSLEVEWPDGALRTYHDVPANQYVSISYIPGDCSVDGLLQLDDFASLQSCLNGPLGSSLSFSCQCADQNGDDVIDLKDYAGFQSGP